MIWTWESPKPGVDSPVFQKIWKAPILKQTKTKVFKVSVEVILLYGSESWSLNIAKTKRLDGVYTKMLRTIYNLSWMDHPTNASVYRSLPRKSEVVRCWSLALAGHTARHDEPACRLLTWVPEESRRIGRPNITLREQSFKKTPVLKENIS